jgi:23S rRNA (guanosine2251-2'-O)-methyltransferase
MTDRKDKGSPKDSHYARLRRAHRDSKPQPPQDSHVHLYGLHTVRAALDNPKRRSVRLLATRNALARLDEAGTGDFPCPIEMVEPKAIDQVTGSGAVHQGVLLEAEPLRPKPLGALGDTDLVLVLDQVTDPHNVGAIMRSAVAFKAGALVTTARHSPVESGVLAKAASGALEHIDHIEVRNLAEALASLSKDGFTTIGLDSEGPETLERTGTGPKIALVLGAEGKGLRQKTRETVDHLARIDMPGAIRSLNVSNAAVLSLYICRHSLGNPKA